MENLKNVILNEVKNLFERYCYFNIEILLCKEDSSLRSE